MCLLNADDDEDDADSMQAPWLPSDAALWEVKKCMYRSQWDYTALHTRTYFTHYPQLSFKSLLLQELLLSRIHYKTPSRRWLRYHDTILQKAALCYIVHCP